MRENLLECCALDWSKISPAIFGAMFQSIMDKKLRRNLGAHYTSEKNILKLIKPLFLDDLRAEFERVKGQRRRLEELHTKIASLKFLDPACGCGNFLVIAYRELRLLELDILRVLYRDTTIRSLDVSTFIDIKCDVDQFYGIEIEEFPAQIAQTALWLMDHQMNMLVSEEFGNYFVRLPLKKSASIVHDNALRLGWETVVSPADLSFILGNPPFGGKQYKSSGQKADQAAVFRGVSGAGVLDFVAPWYRKATDYMAANPAIRAAFVSTNSITQGEQVGILWPDLFKRGIKIQFAHRTFQWSSEARGKAAVHCVIIGFGLSDSPSKKLFDYENPQADPHEIQVQNINAYLVDAANIFLTKRRTPIDGAPALAFGNMPNDGGYLLLNKEERDDLLRREPRAQPYIRPFMGSDEYINRGERYCLWLKDVPAAVLKSMPVVMARINGVQQHRKKSARATTKRLARVPMLFGEIRQPDKNYLAIPEVSSERRRFIPMGFLDKNVVASNKLYTAKSAALYHFGVVESAMHMGWTRTVCGRLESRYQYSAGIVYNNFPWPQKLYEKEKDDIEEAAQGVLDARAKQPASSLADLYDPLSMPPDLVKAHQKLDAAVDAAYSRKKFSGDADRVAFLFSLYQAIAAPLAISKAATRRKTTSP
jgi:hypothetical protein